MTEIYCSHCGHKNQSGANFCSSCGRPLDRPDEPTTISFQLEGTSPDLEDELLVNVDDVPADGGLLVVVRGPNAGARLALTKDVTTAGRHPDSDLFLDDVTVSRRHAEFHRGALGFRVRDVGSLNGTYLNRERVDEADLADCDEIQIGRYKLAFYAGPGATTG